MIPRLKPYLNWHELVAAFSRPRHDDVEQFEQAFAAKMGQKYALAFPYGRTGLMLLLEALGLKNKEIICPAYTCVVVPHAIVYSGNTPVFVDSQEEDFNINLDLVPDVITEHTKAIIATSIFGYPVNLDKLDIIRQQYPHIHIIQDCAHSFAAEWKGRPVQKEGIAAIFGLNISKLITSIFGGMVTTDDVQLFERLRILRSQRLKPASLAKSIRRLLYLLVVYPAFWGPIYGMVNRLERSGILNYFVKYYDEGAIDMPSDYLEGMTAIEARVGQAQLEKYEPLIEQRRKVAAFYHEQLKDLPTLHLPPLVGGATYSHYVPQVQHRETMLQYALRKGIQLGWLIEYSIPEMQSYGANNLQAFPVAGNAARETINLPIWGDEDVAHHVIPIMRSIFD